LWQEYNGNPSYMWYRRHYSLGAEPWSSIPVSGLVEALERKTAGCIPGRQSVSMEMKVVAYTGSGRVHEIRADGTVAREAGR
jgi:hypothetical protein